MKRPTIAALSNENPNMPLRLKIGILSFTPLDKKEAVGNLMLKKAAVGLGHSARIFRDAHFQFILDDVAPRCLYQGQNFSPPDIMIVRASVLQNVDLAISTVKHLQLMKIPVVNYYLPIVRAKNKVRTMQILSHEGIPIPKTVMITSLDYLDTAVAQIGSFPLIVKIPNGSEGIGVSIIESNRSLRSMVELMSANFRNTTIIIQEYVKEAKGKDIRVFVVGDEIVAAMERKAKRGEFRANFERGGSVSLTDLSETEKEIALAAAKAIGLHVAGVDIIRTATGPKILEVNSNPGLEGITQATGVNVAEHMVRFAEKLLQQRRTVPHKEDILTVA